MPSPTPAINLKPPLVLLGLAAIALPFDGTLSRAAIWLGPNSPNKWGGDPTRELTVLMQFGAPASIVIVVGLLFCIDHRRSRRLLDLAAAVAATSLVMHALKILLGRVRPGRGGDLEFLTVLGKKALHGSETAISSWQIGTHGVSDLWSMPSSHTSSAVVLAVFLVALFPRIAPVAWGLTAVVGIARILFGAHYVSDVFVGAAVGLLIATPLIRGYMGVRLVDALWTRFVNRENVPKLDGLLEYERSISGGASPSR